MTDVSNTAKVSISPELLTALEDINKLLPEVAESSIQVIKTFLCGSDVVISDCDRTVTTDSGATESFMTIKPSERFLKFTAALRAGEWDGKFI